MEYRKRLKAYLTQKFSQTPGTQHNRRIFRMILGGALLSLLILIAQLFPHGISIFFPGNFFSFGNVRNLSSFHADTTLLGQNEGRTNVMIYGLTSDQYRTDTILLASYYWKEHRLVLLNIPRDLYATVDGNTTKIVSLYAIAKKNHPNDHNAPPQYVSNFISNEYRIPIHYWVVINMNAFVQLIDQLGGITVTVERSFTDYEYPTDDYTNYIRPAPHFDAGIQTLTGAQALIFARSRHSTDPREGTDFARSRRQELILQAILKKLKAQNILSDITHLNAYITILDNNVFTNMDPTEIVQSIQVAGHLDPSHDILKANWSNNIGFLCDSTAQDGGYILLYGVPGNCVAVAGSNSSSTYQQKAVNYIQNLLQSATQRQ